MTPQLKLIPAALALLLPVLGTPAFAEGQLSKLNNQVYAGAAIEHTTFNGEATVRPQDAVYMAVNEDIEAKNSGVHNLYAGARWQPGDEGPFLEVQGRHSQGTLAATVTVTGAKNPPPPESFHQDWTHREVLTNLGWAVSMDGASMQLTPFITAGSSAQRQLSDFGTDGSQTNRIKTSFVGVGFRHQTSLSPTLALEVEAVYARHRLSWNITNLDVFGQPVSAPVDVSVKHGDEARVALGLSQELWKALRVNYGLRYAQLTASGVSGTTPLSFRQATTSAVLGVGLTF